MSRRTIPLPLATLVMLLPVAAFWNATDRLAEARLVQREQRLRTEAAVAEAQRVFLSLERQRSSPQRDS